MKFIIYFIIFIYFINNIATEEIFTKNGKKNTNLNYIIFDSSKFSIGKNMNFILKSNYYCENIINYGYYDDLDNIMKSREIPYKINISSEEIELKDKEVISKTKYYSIEKNKYELNGLKGDYLLLYFSCSGEVEIKNGKKKLGTKEIIIIVVACVIGVLIISLILYCLLCKNKYKNNNNINNNNNNNFNNNYNNNYNYNFNNNYNNNYNKNFNNNYINNYFTYNYSTNNNVGIYN